MCDEPDEGKIKLTGVNDYDKDVQAAYRVTDITCDKVIMISPLIHFLAGLFCRVRPRSFSSYCHTALWYPETGNFPHAQTNLRHGARWR